MIIRSTSWGPYSFWVTIVSSLIFETFSVNVKPQREVYLPDYSVYHNLSRIGTKVKYLSSRFPNFLHVDLRYTSLEKQPQYLLHLSNFTHESKFYTLGRDEIPKIKIFLSFGEHAREFFPVESMLHLVQNLTEGCEMSSDSFGWNFSHSVLTKFDIFILAMANPDGRKLVEQTQNFCWRGTSRGVDINRNFPWEFGHKGSSGDPLDEEYRGTRAFSEPESKVFQDLTREVTMDAFISFHSGARHIYLPFADTLSQKTSRLPKNYAGMWSLAAQLSAASTQQFRFGQAYDLNSYTADGTSFDYMAGVKEIPFSLAIEMWENKKHTGSSCFDLFNPRSESLLADVEDFHQVYVSLFAFLQEWQEKKTRAQQESLLLEPPPLTLGYVLVALVVLLFLCMAAQGRPFNISRLVLRRRIISLRTLSSSLTFLNPKAV